MPNTKKSATSSYKPVAKAGRSLADEIIRREGLPKLPGEPHEPFPERIPVRDLHVDMTYQRPLSEKKLEQKRKAFSEAALGSIYVSLRTSGYYILDGQHRVTLAREKLGPNYEIRALVYIDLTPEQEAKMFDYFHGVTWNKLATGNEQFKARLAAGEKEELTINQIVERNGFKLTFHTGKLPRYGIRAVTALKTIYRAGGIHMLEQVLRIIREAWDGETGSTQQEIFWGLAAFLGRYGHLINEEKFIAKLRDMPVSKVRRMGAEFAGVFGGLATSYGRAFLEIYNKQRSQNRLPPWEETNVYASRMAQAKASVESESGHVGGV